MGNQQSRSDPEIKYLIQSRKDPVHFKINDDFPYPRRPKSKEVDQQFNEILKLCILSEDQLKEVASLKDESKWRLICKHRYFMLTAKNKSPETTKQKSKAQLIIEALKISDSIAGIDKLHQWLTTEAKESDINDFILFEGLSLLLNILTKAETCSRATQNYNKELIILQIFDFLSSYQQVITALVQIPKSLNVIFVNFNKAQLTLIKPIFSIMTNISWNSKEGPRLVLESVSFYKSQNGYKLRFEPFIQILEETKNVILLEMLTMFINTLIESPAQEERRSALRSEFTICDIKNIYRHIKEKIKGNKYRIEDSVRGSESPREKRNRGDPSSLLLLDDKEQFDEKLVGILKQIEIFEKGFDECIEEEDEDSDEDRQAPVGETQKRERKQGKKKKTVDFSDINEVFAKVVSQSLTNDNYENFFKMLQQLCLLPNNEQTKKVWSNLNHSLQSVTGVKQDNVLKTESLEALIEQTQTKEELEQKILFLDAQLKARDDDIRDLKRGKLNMEIQLKGSKKDAEKYEKELNKQMESLKALDTQLNELRKTKTSPDAFSSQAKKQGETGNYTSSGGDINNTSVAGSSSIGKKGLSNSMNQELEKKTQGLDKKNITGNKSGTTTILESENIKKSPRTVSVPDQDSKKQVTVPIQEYEEKIKQLNCKISELEKFINSGIEEGFTESQYNQLQTGLEHRGFAPFKNKFKVQKAEAEKKTSEIPGKPRKPAAKSDQQSAKYNFDTEKEGLSTDKNMSFPTSVSSKDQTQNQNPSNENKSPSKTSQNAPTQTSNTNNANNVNNANNALNEKNTTNNNSADQNLKQTSAPIENRTIQIIITNPIGKLEEKPNIFEDKSQSPQQISKPANISQISQVQGEVPPPATEKKLFLPQLSTLSQGTEEVKSPEVKSPDAKKEEDKSPEIKSPPPPPPFFNNSETNSPSNSPMNMPPLPPPLMGGKPGLPPGLNLMNLLNKKPAGPVKEKKKPNVPMKSILWTLVNPLNIKGTIWETIDEGTVTIEIPSLEAEFTSVRPDKPVAKSTIPSKVSLLAPNRSQNLNIVLSKLKMSPSSIVEAILTVNEELLNLNMVSCLIEAIPTPDEISLVSNYNGDIDMLENPEKFVLEIKDIKNLKVRLQAMQFFFTHKELFDDLQLKIKKLIDLFENISKEQRIIVLMKYTLAIGNYMNGESARGGAFGFKLDVFDKMGDIKNMSGKKTLLAFVIDIIEKNTGSPFIEVNEEFLLYEFGRKQPISQLFSDLDFIKKGIEQVKIAKRDKNQGVVDNIEEFMKRFEIEVTDKFQDAEFDLGTLDQKYKRVCEFYCEDPKQMSSDGFVESFYKIWTACKKAKALLVKESKENKKEKTKEKEKAHESSSPARKSIMFNNPEELANAINNLRKERETSIGKMKMENRLS